MFSLHTCGLPDAIQPGYRGGLGCTEFLARQSDPRGFYGDTPTNLCQRAQLLDEYRPPFNTTHEKKFRILVPDDWINDPYPVAIAGDHSVAFSIAPWSLWIYGDHFTFEAAVPDPTNANGNGFKIVIHKEIPIIKERWHAFDLKTHVSQGTNNGYFDLTVDGVNLCSPKNFYGETIRADDVGPPYTEYGPYVFGHWPVGVTFRHLFMVLGL